MKDFLSEYGFAILAAIVVILLIAMCTPVGNLIKNQVLGVVDSFAGKTEAKLAAIDDDAAVKVTLKQFGDGKADGKKGLFNVIAASESDNDTFIVEYRVKDQNGNWGAYAPLYTKEGATAKAEKLSTGAKDHEGHFTAVIENGNQIQVRVVDEAKDANAWYESNIVTYTGASQTTVALIASGLAE